MSNAGLRRHQPRACQIANLDMGKGEPLRENGEYPALDSLLISAGPTTDKHVRQVLNFPLALTRLSGGLDSRRKIPEDQDSV